VTSTLVEVTRQHQVAGTGIRGGRVSWWRAYTTALVLLDALAITCGSLVGGQLRFGRLTAVSLAASRFSYVGVAALLIPAWIATMTLSGTYERRYLDTGSEEYRRVFGASLRFLAVVATLAFLLKVEVARGFVGVAIPVAAALALCERYLARKWLHRRRGRLGSCMKSAVVAGSAQGVCDIVRALRAAPFVGYSVVGICTPGDEETVNVDGERLPVLAGTDQIVASALGVGADAIVVADEHTISIESLRALAWQLEGSGIGLLVAPAVTDVAGPRISMRPVSGIPLVSVEEPELSGVRRLVKEAFDRSAATVAIILLSPILLAIGLIIRLSSDGPAFFRQVRIGLRGQRFVMWKFRTMTADAEDRLEEVLHLNEHDGVLFKITDDPRMTRLGRLLRRWSIDELPQLLNVVRGEMSIVGPRPPLPHEVERYDVEVRRRLLVKPGLTGLWQVSGRAGLPWEEAVRLDLHYVENWSPSLDAVILAKTVVAVLRRHGAS